MDKYKNEDYLMHQIMDQSRHQFIYGYDGLQRKQFLENIASHYPIVLDKNFPMAIYVAEFGLPKIIDIYKDVDKNKIAMISREFLYLSVASDILIKAKTTIDGNLLNERIRRLIWMLNKYNINKDYPSIENLDSLIDLLIQSKEFYKKYYIEYYGQGIESTTINEVGISHLQIDMFISQLKRALNNESYFGIIIDKQDEIAISSTQAINFLIGKRINSDISMKIAIEPDKWDLYKDSNGQLIDCVHDYGTVELDDSQSQHLKRLKKV